MPSSRQSRHWRGINRRQWERTRRVVLDRDGYRCSKCGRAGRLEVDHVIPLDRGGAAFDLDNLQALCRGCHLAKSNRERARPVSPEQAAWRRLVRDLLGSAS